MKHPGSEMPWPVSDDLRAAAQYECFNSLKEIDAFRECVVQDWLKAAAVGAENQRDFLQEQGFTDSVLRNRVNYNFLHHVLQMSENPDESLFTDMLFGFPVVGSLPPCLLEAKEKDNFPPVLPREEFEELRQVTNSKIADSMKESEFSADLMEIAEKDVELGALGSPQPLSTALQQQVHIARRIAVREYRPSGWRTRAVDDMTEMLLNPATEQSDKQVNETVLHLVWMLLFFCQASLDVDMWKRDIQNAFRRLPVLSAHVLYVWVSWIYNNTKLAAPHFGMPFGAVSSVVAWHRVGAALSRIIQRNAKAPIARYVDDFFGCSRRGLKWTGGTMLYTLCSLIGLLCDPKKDVDGAVSMIALGLMVETSLDHSKVMVRLEAEKASAWHAELLSAYAAGKLSPEHALKLAGRAQWALCCSRSKVGRSYLKAVFAQAYKPWRDNLMSPRLRQASSWLLDYFVQRPASVWHSLDETRQHVRTWSDASGVDQLVAVFLLVDGAWRYTSAPAPSALVSQFLPRGDNQIGMLELLAPILAVGTWPQTFCNVLWTAWIDNQGVLHDLLKGGSLAEDANVLIGRLWLSLASSNTALYVERVESKSNVADGPTRHDFSDVTRLHASFSEPVWPTWASEIWK